MSERFSDKVAIVTGGSRGIGLDICKSLAREGARVVIASVDEARGVAATDIILNLGGQAEFLATDVTQRDQVARLVEYTLKRFGIDNADIFDLA